MPLMTIRLGNGKWGTLDLDNPTGGILVDGSAVTQPVSGIVNIAAVNTLTTDTFTTTGIGATYTPSISYRSFALQVKGTGATPTLWTVILEGSIDGVNFSTIMTHTQAILETILWTGTNFYPIIAYRVRTPVLTLGGASNIVVTLLGTT